MIVTAHAKTHGKLHVLIANAGYMSSAGSIAESGAEDWWTGFEVNVKANFNLVRAFLPHAVADAVVFSTNTTSARLPFFSANLPASITVWAASKEAKLLNGQFAWANWDVDELKAAAAAIEEGDKFTTGLLGSP